MLPPSEIMYVQHFIGTLMYYAIEVDKTMLTSLGYLAYVQSKISEKTMETITHLLNHTATIPNAKI